MQIPAAAPTLTPQFWPGESIRMADDDLDLLFAWSCAIGASDIRLESNKPAVLQVHGRLQRVTQRRLTDGEIEDAVNRLYGADGVARLKSGQDFDVSYEIQPDRRTRLRFRVNATAVLSRGADGAAVVVRTMPEKSPRLENLKVEPQIAANFKVRQGFVIIAGGTENGKSTLLAAMTRELLEDPESHRSIIEYAAPIEFVYDDIDGAAAMISQSEIPRHLPSFAAGARNAMRRNPKVVIIGECRDTETMPVACQLSIAGCCVMTTVHAGSVHETVQRCVSLCPVEERAAVTVQLAQSLRLIVNQRLVRATDGMRTALREFLVFDDALRRRLLRASPDAWPEICGEALTTHGQSFVQAARSALIEGRISEETEFTIRKEFGDVA
jgi:defect-in-organelle-trafficking protein DotB